MRCLLCILIGTFVFSSVQVLGSDEERKPLLIFNDSDIDIVVVVQTPSLQSAFLVEVPMRTVVHNIPIPVVEDDQIAIAYTARATPDGLLCDVPLNIVGLVKLLRRQNSRHTNSTIPVLWYRGPRDQTMASSTQDDMHVFLSPLSTAEARSWVQEAMAMRRKIDFQKLEAKADTEAKADAGNVQ